LLELITYHIPLKNACLPDFFLLYTLLVTEFGNIKYSEFSSAFAFPYSHTELLPFVNILQLPENSSGSTGNNNLSFFVFLFVLVLFGGGVVNVFMSSF